MSACYGNLARPEHPKATLDVLRSQARPEHPKVTLDTLRSHTHVSPTPSPYPHLSPRATPPSLLRRPLALHPSVSLREAWSPHTARAARPAWLLSLAEAPSLFWGTCLHLKDHPCISWPGRPALQHLLPDGSEPGTPQRNRCGGQGPRGERGEVGLAQGGMGNPSWLMRLPRATTMV